MEKKPYPFADIEKKWQSYWDNNKTFTVTEDENIPKEKRKYILDMFPYPSAAGLHVGHPEGYTATDIYSRYLRMNGYAVLHPIGFDSFGLPAENYAIQNKTHPQVTTEKNIAKFRTQIKRLGFSYDWQREISTHTAQYYRWTQWIFLQLYKKNLAYEKHMPMWYCPELGTVLANEEVILSDEGPRSERGKHPVERRPLRQWMLKITEYAERLLKDLEELDWPESIKAMQRNWIGKSEGALIRFCIEGIHENENGKTVLEAFTTRPDTLWGCTYMVLSPEHPQLEKLISNEQRNAVETYVYESARRSDLERAELLKEKTGVFTGSYAINPVTKLRIPLWISDYVLMGYGTGAIMAVPAHDERDFDFAKKFKLPIVEVIISSSEQIRKDHELHEAYTDTINGLLVNSGKFSGMSVSNAKPAIIQFLEAQKIGCRKTQYKLRDWIFSRQRYWGEPIPLMHTKDGTIEALNEEKLPLRLPEVESYKPTGTGESPLAAVSTWVETTLADGTPAKRETNTMPQWAGSCWYYLRYVDPYNVKEFANRKKIDYWMPVDLYVGGAEHAVLHLLYTRFWHKVLYDLELVGSKEPFQKLINQGMILGEDGNKMSKSLGNVINPDTIVDEYGADSLRMYEMFIGPLRQEKPWATKGLVGIHRFLSRVWNLRYKKISDDPPPIPLEKHLHKSIKKITHDTENLACNTAIAQMMILVNEIQKHDVLYTSVFDAFIRLLAPYAPHLAEELWEFLGKDAPVSLATWPTWDEALTVDDMVEIVFQINGKLRAKQLLPHDTDKAYLEQCAAENEAIQKHLADKTVRKIIVIPNKLVNFVVS